MMEDEYELLLSIPLVLLILGFNSVVFDRLAIMSASLNELDEGLKNMTGSHLYATDNISGNAYPEVFYGG